MTFSAQQTWIRPFRAAFAVYIVIEIFVIVRQIMDPSLHGGTDNFYLEWADLIADGGWPYFSAYLNGDAVDPWGNLTVRMPLFPLMVAGLYALFGKQVILATVFNTVMLTASLWLVHLIGRRVSPFVGFFAPLAMMVDTLFLTNASSGEAEVSSIFFLLVAVWLLIREIQSPRSAANFALAALAVSVAIYIRPASMYLWIPVGVTLAYVAWQRSAIRWAAMGFGVFAVVQAAVLVPWMLRSHSLTGDFSFAPGARSVFLLGYFVPKLVSFRDGIDFRDAKAKAYADVGLDIDSGRNIETVAPGTVLEYSKNTVFGSPVQTAKVMMTNFGKMFLSFSPDPIAYFISEQGRRNLDAIRRGDFDALKERKFYSLTSLGDSISQHYKAGLIAVLAFGSLFKIFNAFLIVAGIAGVWTMWRNSGLSAVALFLTVTTVLFTGLMSLDVGARHRLTVEPMIYLLAASAISAAGTRLSRTRRVAKAQ
jgi:hypothetical protein